MFKYASKTGVQGDKGEVLKIEYGIQIRVFSGENVLTLLYTTTQGGYCHWNMVMSSVDSPSSSCSGSFPTVFKQSASEWLVKKVLDFFMDYGIIISEEGARMIALELDK